MARSVERHTNRQEIDKRMLEQRPSSSLKRFRTRAHERCFSSAVFKLQQLRYIVHTADVGHPFRPVPQHQEWARRVNEAGLVIVSAWTDAYNAQAVAVFSWIHCNPFLPNKQYINRCFVGVYIYMYIYSYIHTYRSYSTVHYVTCIYIWIYIYK